MARKVTPLTPDEEAERNTPFTDEELAEIRESIAAGTAISYTSVYTIRRLMATLAKARGEGGSHPCCLPPGHEVGLPCEMLDAHGGEPCVEYWVDRRDRWCDNCRVRGGAL